MNTFPEYPKVRLLLVADALKGRTWVTDVAEEEDEMDWASSQYLPHATLLEVFRRMAEREHFDPKQATYSILLSTKKGAYKVAIREKVTGESLFGAHWAGDVVQAFCDRIVRKFQAGINEVGAALNV